jgi:hydroxyquinol 1,2-dioxygenase
MAEGFFTEANSAEVVVARNAEAEDARLKEVMAVITRHLHAAVKEIEPTQEEWLRAITFLTDTGHMCTDWRQEFILLSDILGVSMLVDAINNRKPSGASESTVLGPFHVEGAPELPMGANICLDAKGEPMFVHGRILDTAGRPVEGARIDVWQANDEGFYDVQQKGLQPDFNLRGVFRTGADGRYWFRGVKPKFYPIPDDGPVGKLLRSLGRHPVPARASPLHHRGGGVRDPGDPHLRPRRSLHRVGRGLRREGEPSGRVPLDRGRRGRDGGGVRRRLPRRGARFRAGRRALGRQAMPWWSGRSAA